MNRRGFIGRLIGAAAAAAAAPAAAAKVLTEPLEALTRPLDLPAIDALDMRAAAIKELAQWWRERIDVHFINALMGDEHDEQAGLVFDGACGDRPLDAIGGHIRS